MPEAVILGSGTSHGVPMLGAVYPEQFLANPKNHRTRPSALLRLDGGNVLIDCTPELRLQLLRENVRQISAVLLTHGHADHIMGMDDLRVFSARTSQPLPVYARPETLDDVRRVYPYATEPPPARLEVPQFDLRPLPDRLEVLGECIEVLEVVHGARPIAAFRIRGFAYVTDVSEIPPAAWDSLQGLDTLVLDAVRIRPHPTHYHLERAVEVALELGANRTYFTHLSHDFDHDKVNAQLPSGIELAYDGLVIPL